MAKSDDLNLDQSLEKALEEMTHDGLSEAPYERKVSHALMPQEASEKSVTKMIQKYSQCEFCGARLHFNYVTDFSCNTTQEKASCPECGLEARQLLHRLQ